MGTDLREVIREVLADRQQRVEFVASFLMLVFLAAVIYALLFLGAELVYP